jgi:hypothetical protein
MSICILNLLNGDVSRKSGWAKTRVFQEKDMGNWVFGFFLLFLGFSGFFLGFWVFQIPYSPFCVPAKVTTLVGLKRPPFLSPTNLIIFACTQNGEYFRHIKVCKSR